MLCGVSNSACYGNVCVLYTFLHCSLAADIVESRLEMAQKAGANVIINCKKENLKERGIST